MLVVYRKNADFAGQLVTLHRTLLAAEMDAYIAQAEHGADVGYIEIAERMLTPEVLIGLTIEPARYRVVAGALQRDGVAVALGYDAALQESALASLKSDVTIRKFFTMTDAQLRTYLAGVTWQDAVLVLRSIIVKICRGVGLVE